MATPAVSNLRGTPFQSVQIGNKNPQQMEMFRQFGMGSNENISKMLQQLGGLAGGGDEETWRQLEAPALRQFGELQGGLASRFSGMGTGARKSSGFQNTMGGAAADLSERLQGQRLGYQRDAQDRLMELYNSLMGEDMFETSLIPKKKKWWETGLEGLSGIGGNAAGTLGGYYTGKKLFG